MKVTFANAGFRPDVHDGANAHIRQFVANAVGLGHRVWMTSGACHPLATPLPSGRAGRTMTLRRMDLVYVRLEDKPAGACTWAVGPKRALLGDPTMVWEFNTVPEYGEYLGLSPDQVRGNIDVLRRFGQGCDLAVCVSAHLAEYVRENLGIARTVVVPNGSDPDLYSPATPVVDGLRDGAGVNVVWIGTADIPWHNLALLGEAARIIWERGDRGNVAFHLLGRGTTDRGGMPPNVHCHGEVDYEALPQWLSGMDIGLCLYRRGPADFASPLKLFDYMSSGLPVIATEQQGEVLAEAGQHDLLIGPDDPVALADLVEKLVADPDRRREIGRRNRDLVVAKYTWRRAVTDTFAEIERIQTRRSSTGYR